MKNNKNNSNCDDLWEKCQKGPVDSSSNSSSDGITYWTEGAINMEFELKKIRKNEKN